MFTIWRKLVEWHSFLFHEENTLKYIKTNYIFLKKGEKS